MVKIVLLGDVGVGKTTLITKYTNPKNKVESSKPSTESVMFHRNE